MANGFFPAMQLQGVDVGQFGRGLAQGQQLRANQDAMRMREQQFAQQQQAQGVQNLAGLMSGVDSIEQANIVVQNAINSGQLSGPAATLATQKLNQYAQLDPTSAETMFKADVAGLQAQAYGQSLAGADRVQSSTYIPGFGFVGLTRGGQTISRELTPEQIEAMKQRQLEQGDVEATTAAEKARAVSGARSETVGREKVEEGVAQSVTTRARGDIDAGLSAGAPLQRVNRMLELLDEGVKTGGWENVKLRTAQLFGIEGADEAELAYNMGKDVISQYRETFGAAFTKSEGDKLDRIEKSFGKSAAANRRLLKQLQNMYNARINKAIVKAKGSHKGSRLGTDDEVTELQAYLSGNFGGEAPAVEESDAEIEARYGL